MEEDKLILSYHDVVIRQSDLKTLEPGQWLNDTMLSFHMEFLERTFVPKEANYLFLRPGMVQLITFIEGDVTQLEAVLPSNMDKYEAVFMPINDGQPSAAYSGTHWSLMVFIRGTNSFYYYDTLRFNNLRDAELTCKRIQPLLKLDKPAQFIPSSAPQQDNGSDCGLYVIAMIDYILERLLKSRGKEDIAYNKMMIIKPKYLSTPKQIRDNINGMIKRLQQRQLNKSHK
ncbi:hypothetical protein G6F70_002391 [Rhizopus microsporus]|uniref:Cysteine proteinase n=2 Tax=Rhizopus TaxID=4842 RepID=A0A1X0S5Z0_RHIZD|nr:hypothetical protein G6F71_002541 [Rhizopus microsporus]KAG1202305.1 hypothetical protein G6F70_002391 [Rhizopus microsporus]KAG1213992.1 hypothetical protein G6F69_002336 [Rhizopus microsporus]KAG1236319.1 hypothetical protein G6F67_002089 [Rhizopus microsporus]KAG1268238.1 hypothetical protein G6F68_001261 [Rhizopus microsporus]